MSVRGLDMISFTSGGGAAGANCAASAPAAIAMGRMIFFMATPSGLAQICFLSKPNDLAVALAKEEALAKEGIAWLGFLIRRICSNCTCRLLLFLRGQSCEQALEYG